MQEALNALALAAPKRLRAIAEPEWFACQGSRVERFNMLKTEAGRKQLGTVICLDGQKLPNVIGKADARLELVALPVVQLLE